MSHGFIIKYDNEHNLLMFEHRNEKVCYHSGRANVIVIIGGLGDGLQSLPFANRFGNFDDLNTIEVELRSSRSGFGVHSLDDDAEDISKLFDYLEREERERIMLLGHSTGCQSILHYLRMNKGAVPKALKAVVLHAPVSDREFLFSSLPDAAERLAWAEEQCAAGFPRRIHEETLFGALITAYRLKSLLAKNGDDDYFSVDLTDEERKERFSGICVPTFVFWNGDDEYVPDKTVYQKLAESFKTASKKIDILPIFERGEHSSLSVWDLEKIINKYININWSCDNDSEYGNQSGKDSENDDPEEESQQ